MVIEVRTVIIFVGILTRKRTGSLLEYWKYI